jgi:hypothetical protein
MPAVQAAGCWKATITQQWTDTDLIGSVLRVSVWGEPWLPVEVRSRGDFRTVGYTNTKPEYGPFVAEFAPLSRGTYYIEPQGLGIVFEIWLDGRNYTRVDFTPVPCAPPPTPEPSTRMPTPSVRTWPAGQGATTTPPPPPTPTPRPQPSQGWYGQVTEQTNNAEGGILWGTIAVRVIGRPAGQQVEIRSDGWSATGKTGTKPEHGPDALEFGGLGAGTYRLTPLDLGTHLDVTVEPGDFMMVEFRRAGEPAVRWVGSVTQNTSGDQPTEHSNSAIAVVVAGRPWHKVEIRSDNWNTTCETGYKPEYGPDACEVGALRAGTYTVVPAGLGTSAQVTVDGWGWAMVRFDQITVPAPAPPRPTVQATPVRQPAPGPGATATATAEAGAPAPHWRGWVVSNSSGEQKGDGVSSVIVVRVLGWRGVPVRITGGGGWSTTCVTGTKPEYGPDACEFGGLWPGTYRLQPNEADIEVSVPMDGLGIAFVEFATQ